MSGRTVAGSPTAVAVSSTSKTAEQRRVTPDTRVACRQLGSAANRARRTRRRSVAGYRPVTLGFRRRELATDSITMRTTAPDTADGTAHLGARNGTDHRVRRDASVRTNTGTADARHRRRLTPLHSHTPFPVRPTTATARSATGGPAVAWARAGRDSERGGRRTVSLSFQARRCHSRRNCAAARRTNTRTRTCPRSAPETNWTRPNEIARKARPPTTATNR